MTPGSAEEERGIDLASRLDSLTDEAIEYRTRSSELAYRELAGGWVDTVVAVTWAQALRRSSSDDEFLASALRYARSDLRQQFVTCLVLACAGAASLAMTFVAARDGRDPELGHLLLVIVGTPIALTWQFSRARRSLRWYRNEQTRLAEEYRARSAAARSLADRSRALLELVASSTNADELTASADRLRQELASIENTIAPRTGRR